MRLAALEGRCCRDLRWLVSLDHQDEKQPLIYRGKDKASMLLKAKENGRFRVKNEPKQLNSCVSNRIDAKLAAPGVMIRTRLNTYFIGILSQEIQTNFAHQSL